MGLIKTMPIGQDKTRVGIITYNSDVSIPYTVYAIS